MGEGRNVKTDCKDEEILVPNGDIKKEEEINGSPD